MSHSRLCSNNDRAASLFKQCLAECSDVELFSLYLKFIKDTKAAAPTFRAQLVRSTTWLIAATINGNTIFVSLNHCFVFQTGAYEFCVNALALEVQSGSVWMDYMNFVKVCSMFI